MEKYINKVIQGDCLEVMKDIPDKSIDMILTSPPYDNLRDYNGYTFDFESIAKELYRITKEGGVVVWVVGDATIKGSETGTSFKQALYFKEIGFNLHDTMIYEKLCYMPLTHKRQEQAFEYMFVFSKGVPKTFNPRLKKNKEAGKTITGNRRHNGNDLEKIHGAGKQIKEYGQDINIWRYATGKTCYDGDIEARKHPAVFPSKLAEDHILTWSNEGDTILDPMAGSGTTLKMAKKNNRNYIGIEISPEYIDIINKRLSSTLI
jgi:site-specific DNA-methyltransferase (adenine-specific)